VRYRVDAPGRTTIDIFDIAGQRIATLVDAHRDPGVYQTTWQGKDQRGIPVSAGIYLVRLQKGSFAQVQKMILVK
jgi:flagellar hook assembly protein FlgD